MEGNTPGRGSGVPGEEVDIRRFEEFSMTPDDRELVRAARERFHLMEKLDQVNNEIRVIISEVSQFDKLADETGGQFGGLSGETKELLGRLRGSVKKILNVSSDEVRKHLEGLYHQRDFIIARLNELKESNEKATEYPARMNHLLGTGNNSEMGGRALLLVLDGLITGDSCYTDAVRRKFVEQKISEYREDKEAGE